jgi:hypothetical protein
VSVYYLMPRRRVEPLADIPETWEACLGFLLCFVADARSCLKRSRPPAPACIRIVYLMPRRMVRPLADIQVAWDTTESRRKERRGLLSPGAKEEGLGASNAVKWSETFTTHWMLQGLKKKENGLPVSLLLLYFVGDMARVSRVID